MNQPFSLPKLGKREKLLVLILLGVGIAHLISALSASFVFEGRRYFVLVDDAMISMRYARNLAEVGSIQYNPADLSTPQGYSNTLWVLLMYIVHALRVPENLTSLTMMLTGAFFHISFVLVIFRITKSLSSKAWTPLAAAFLSATFFSAFYWSTRGMEFSLQILLAYLLIELALRNDNKAKISGLLQFIALGLLLSITRIDSFLILTVCSTSVAIEVFRSKSNNIAKKWAFASAYLITPFLFLSLAFAYNLHYHGDKYPTTYYLKVSGATLLERVQVGLSVLRSHSFIPLSVAISSIVLVIIFSPVKEYLNRKIILLMTIFASQLAYSVYTGGDYAECCVFAPNRFLSIGLPSAFVVLAVLAEKARLRNLLYPCKDSGSIASLLLKINANVLIGCIWVFMAIIINLRPLIQSYKERGLPMLSSDIERAERGLLIRKTFDASCRVAAHAAGNIFYFANNFFVIDLLGKSDNVIAKSKPVTSFYPGHNKWNYNYSILQLNADIIADEFGWLGFQEWVRINEWGEYPLLDTGKVVYRAKGAESCFDTRKKLY